MARPPEGLGRASLVGQQAARQRAVVGADAGADAFVGGVDGDGVGRLVGVRVVLDHLRELQGGGARGRHGGADVARRVADQEGGFGGREGRGGDDEVAFVFARGGVEDDDKFVVGWGWGLTESMYGEGGGRKGERGEEDALRRGEAYRRLL